MVVGICAIIKDCPQEYLKEWITWHTLLGVSYFFIYDNDSEIPISSFIKKENVYVRKMPGAIQQLPAYMDCINRQKYKMTPACDWIAFIDDDEFIMVENGDICSLLSKQKNSGLCLNWITYGFEGEVKTNQSQFKKYVRHTPVSFVGNTHIKSIVRPLLVQRFSNPHFCKYQSGWAVDILGNHVPGPFCTFPQHKIAWINHYYCKTPEEFQKKIKKGRVDSPLGYSMDYCLDIDKHATETSDKTEKIVKLLAHEPD